MSVTARTETQPQLERALLAWDTGPIVEDRLSGGTRQEVWSVVVRGRRCVARRSVRSPEALDWELALLDHLSREGVRVPATIPADDGRLHVDGLVVSERLEGHRSSTNDEWERVLAALERIHAVTADFEQRPTFASSQELLTCARGGDVRLDEMPANMVEELREAWRALADEPMSVVHGDPGPTNILVEGSSVGFIDWDEARVDASIMDLAALPIQSIAGFDDARLEAARGAADAWECAVEWFIAPDYARRRLAMLRERRAHQ
jgi:Ser/Thr protein kinase RdoA (MazF antagonist)